MPVSGVIGPLRAEGCEVVLESSELLLLEAVQGGRLDSEQRQELSEAFCHMLMSALKQIGEAVSRVDGADIGKS